MKFNEKLIELRKQNNLSQEELGYKLNVTRQTVSKWELGQTTPEMDKLIEISKLFNISVDELINNSETKEDVTNNSDIQNNVNNSNTYDKNTTAKKSKRERTIISIIVIALVIIIIFIIIRLFAGFTLVNGMNNSSNSLFNKFLGFFENITNGIDDMKDNFSATNFNSRIEMYKGTVVGSNVNSTLDEVITSNKKNERKITVKFNEIETQDSEEIKNIKKDIVYYNDYELSLDYDEEGYINKVTIEELSKNPTTFDTYSFNMGFEILQGSNTDLGVITALDRVIASNKKNDRKITVNYKETETQEENDIINIKKQINNMGEYNISFDYDSDGFINKVTIMDL